MDDLKLELGELAEIVDKYSKGDGSHSTEIAGLSCFKMARPNEKLPVVYRPSLYVIAQGDKQVMLEKELYHYSAGRFLAVSVDLPLVGQVLKASPNKPYLCAQIDLDIHLMSELANSLSKRERKENLNADNLKKTKRGIFIGEMNSILMECILRLMRLLNTPEDIPYLAPLIFQEIYYRLLIGEYSEMIIRMCLKGNNMQRIALVIDQMKTDITKPVVIHELAAVANMSISNFYSQFKKVTALSPLQYQKRLRLTQARQIMLLEGMDATSTAYSVGYESSSQFNREYARLFGLPPLRDIIRLKSLGAGNFF